MKPRIFVSHSAKDDDAAAFLRALVARLKADGFDVFLDRERLRAGDRWRQVLHNEMNLCHGGVLVLSRHVVPPKDAQDDAGKPLQASTFVPIEASVLIHRETIGRGKPLPFPLVPVVVRGADETQFQLGTWKSLDLRSYQNLRAVDAANAAEKAAAVAEALRPLFQKRADTPLDRVEQRLGAILEGVPVGVLEAAAAALAGGARGAPDPGLPADPAWDGAVDGPAELATRLLRAEVPLVYQALRALQSHVEPPHLEEIYYLVAPCWIDYRSAIRLQEIARSAALQRGVAINGKELAFTPRMYVRRADCQTRQFAWRIREVPHKAGDDPASYYETRVRHALLDLVGLGGETGPSTVLDQRIREELARAAQLEEPYFVALSWPGPGTAVLKSLQDRYPCLNLFLLATRFREDEGPLAARSIQYLDPELDTRVESEHKGLDDYIVRRLTPQQKP